VPDCRDPFEPDDTLAEARPLQPDAPETHSLCPVNDQDFYAVALDRRMGLRVSLETEPDRSVLLSVFDASGTLMDEDGTDEAGRASVALEDLPAGTYSMVVRPEEPTEFIASYRISLATWCAPDCANRSCGDDGCGGTCGTCPTDFGCNSQGVCVSTCVDALEPDGSPQQAIPIVPGEGLTRSLCPPADEDWHRVDVPAGTRFRVRYQVAEGAAADAHLLSKDFLEVDSAVLSGQGQVFLEPPAPGTYYLVISASDSEVQVPSYQIVVDFLCAPACEGRDCGDDGCGGSCGDCDPYSTCDAQGRCVSTCVDAFEPDDLPGQAHLLFPKVPRTHSVCPGDDVDWFLIQLGKPTNVTVSVEGSGALDIAFLDVQQTELDSAATDLSGTAVVGGSGLPSGTYFVRASSSDGSQVPSYQIVLSVQ